MNMRQTDGKGVARLMRFRAKWHSEKAKEAADIAHLDRTLLLDPHFTEQYEMALAVHFEAEAVRFETDKTPSWALDTDSLSREEVEVVWGGGASPGEHSVQGQLWTPLGRGDAEPQDGPVV